MLLCRATWPALVGGLFLDCRVHLEKRQKNNIFEAIQRTGLGPEEFQWEQTGHDDRRAYSSPPIRDASSLSHSIS